MLVLSRKLGEKIVIGDNIVVTVVKVDGNQVRLGIEAPETVVVLRAELHPAFKPKDGGQELPRPRRRPGRPDRRR